MEKLKKGDIWHRCAEVTIIYDPDEDPYKDNPEIKKHYKGIDNERNQNNRQIKRNKGDEQR